MAALKECAKMVTTSAGGCTTAFPFEAAIWLLEEQEELFGGTFAVQHSEVGMHRIFALHVWHYLSMAVCTRHDESFVEEALTRGSSFWSLHCKSPFLAQLARPEMFTMYQKS